jgi:hypothetical protein
MGTNCYGPVLFTQLLHPLLVVTAQSSPAASVRVIWMGSIVVHLQAPKSGMDLENLDFKKKDESPAMRYAISKTGDLFIAAEWARRDAQVGIVHLVSEIDQLRSTNHILIIPLANEPRKPQIAASTQHGPSRALRSCKFFYLSY